MAARREAVKREEAVWLRQIDPTRLPRHVAIIMDGNGRWAKRRKQPRQLGHVRGAETAERIIRGVRWLVDRLEELGQVATAEWGRIEYLTLYTFSNENWRRPRDEVSALMGLIESQLREKLADLQETGVSIRLLGRREDLPDSLLGTLQKDIEETSGNQGLSLFLALNYGGRCEIVDAARSLAEDAAAGRLDPGEITEELFAQRLYAPGAPDPELLIRTGGDMRISNFLLWQIAYAELWVTPTLWPAFTLAELYRAIVDYQTRDRRFGGLSNNGTT